ncbi:MAG: hypothetical protein FD143_604, partial [Ignavibacteria bacterium]
MKTIFKIMVLISLHVIGGCKNEANIVETPKDKNEYYEIITIDGKNIEEYRKSPLGLGALDIPNKIIFTRRD